MSDEIMYGSDSDSGSSDQDFDFKGAPVFSNSQIFAAAYPKKDKNGNWYLKVDLPLVGSFNLFVNDSGHDGLSDSWNKLVDHHNEG